MTDPDIQELAAYAAKVIGAPVALVTQLGDDRQTFLANVGFARDWTTLEESFCAHAVLQEGVFEVPDAQADPRFRDNPLVTGNPHVRFYAGVPLKTGEGIPRNALCVLDDAPRELTPFQRETLALLARQVEARLALRRREAELQTERDRAAEANALLLQVTDNLPVRLAYVDRDLRYRFLNGEYARVFGRSIQDAVGRPVEELVGSALYEESRPLLERALAGESYAHTFEASYPFGTIWVEALFTPVPGKEGEIKGVVVQASDVTARVEVARALERSQEALRSANEDLETRVTQRTEELQEAIEQAEGFNYSIAHDLRSPLRAIDSTASILLEDLGPKLSEAHRELLERQSHNATRMGRLIDELLRLARFARVEVERASVDVTAKARRLVAELEEQGRTNGCRFEVQEGMRAEADRELLRTVLHNLLGNACKYSPQGGTVAMGQEGDVFSVSDEGVGFDMAHAARMFLPFERLVRDEEFEGTGIGLANVKRIVERHGGQVWAESAPGKGATFYFTLGASS